MASATRAVRIRSRPRRLLDAERTTTSMTASSSPKRSQTRFEGTGSSYRRGRCQSRSPTVSRPIRARRRARVGPTPWSDSTPATRRSGRGTLRGRGQRSAGAEPAKPAWWPTRARVTFTAARHYRSPGALERERRPRLRSSRLQGFWRDRDPHSSGYRSCARPSLRIDDEGVEPTGLPAKRAFDELWERCSLKHVLKRPLRRGVADDDDPLVLEPRREITEEALHP